MECSWLQVFGLLIFVLKTSRLTEMINASRLGARQSGKTSSKQNRNQLTDIKNTSNMNIPNYEKTPWCSQHEIPTCLQTANSPCFQRLLITCKTRGDEGGKCPRFDSCQFPPFHFPFSSFNFRSFISCSFLYTQNCLSLQKMKRRRKTDYVVLNSAFYK